MLRNKVREDLAMAVAYALPRRVVAWCTVRVFAHGTTGRYSGEEAPALTMAEALRRWPV